MRERTDVPEKYKWNLSDLYPSAAAWHSAKDRFAAEVPQIGQYKGRLVSSPQALADALDKLFELNKEVARLYVYANLLADQDTRNADHEGMRQQMVQLASAFNSESAYLEPEILKADRKLIESFISSEPRLKVHAFYLEDIVRRAMHTLSDAEEKLLAALGPLSSSPSATYNILANADFPYPTMSLNDGRTVRVDPAAYIQLRASSERTVRENVMSAFFSALGSFSRTYGTTINGEIQKELFITNARKYGSALDLALDGPNVPTPVYLRLIDGVNKHLPSFHRYLNLRKRIMCLDQLHYYDLYAPLVSSVDLQYTPEEAEVHILAAVAPLGTDYQSTIRRAFNERWIDLFPTDGKRSGAYSSGSAYDVHPYMLINYNGQYTDVSTLAHELGHTMQSYYSNNTQPYPLAQYPIFVAEVASTFNESLLIDHMLKDIKDRDVRLSLLGNYLESIRGTVFRQTQFAEFELRMHQSAQQGLPVTGDALARLYLEITRRYYGHNDGVCIVDDYVAHEWSFIPHFYHDFYVFQYATSFTASMALAAKVKTGDDDAKRRYIAFLSAGGSKYPIELLKDAGVDMTTDEPLELTIKEMNRVMDEIELLIM
jgi:oligoendopeptidase F